MKLFLARLERAFVRVMLNPKLRPVEHAVAVKLARSVALRVGLSSTALGLVLEVLDRVVS